MATNQELLKSSTETAQKAAALIGGTFQQGRYNSSGQVEGGFTPGPAGGSESSPVPRYATANVNDIVNPPKSNLQQAQEQLFGNTAPLSDADKQAIRDRARSEIQTYLDAVNAQYEQIYQQRQAEGTQRTGQLRAIQNARGTGGSFGSTQRTKLQDYNASVLEGVRAEQRAKVGAILDTATTRALSEIEAESAKRQKNAENYIDYLKGTQTEARSNVAYLAKSGVQLDQLNDEQYKSLLAQTGYSPLVFESLYNANLPENQQIDYKYQVVGNTVMAFYTDPATGKLTQKEFKATVPEGEYDKFELTSDGTPLFINTQQGKAVVAPGFKQGQFAKDESPASYKEWVLAGQPGTYADFIKNKSGDGIFNPSKDEVSAVMRYAQTLPGFDAEKDQERLQSDPVFFYAVLNQAVNASAQSGDNPFSLQPFKYPFLIGQ